MSKRVLVIGGGVIGLSTAYYSAKRGHQVTVLERHEHSSQTFIPLSVKRYLVLATLDAPGGGPDLARLRAFVARAGQGVTYAMGTWHHPVTVLDGPASFAVLMWRDGTAGDEEFVPVTTPLTIVLPQEPSPQECIR